MRLIASLKSRPWLFSGKFLSFTLGASSLVCWVLYVEKSRSNISTTNHFFLGSIDDRIETEIQSGDVVLFYRPFYTLHFPAVLSTAIYRHAFNTKIDTAGIVIRGKENKAFILERTYSGLKFRPYEDRILESKSSQIVIVRLPPTANSLLLKDSINQFTTYEPSTFKRCTGLFFSQLYGSMLKILDANNLLFWKHNNNDDDVTYCPHLELIKNYWKKMHIYVSNDINKAGVGELLEFNELSRNGQGTRKPLELWEYNPISGEKRKIDFGYYNPIIVRGRVTGRST